MKQPRTFLLLSVVVAVLLLGIAYAAIGDITLKVDGTATATAAEGSFDVKFTKVESSGVGTVDELDVGDGLEAVMKVSGLTKVNDTFTAKFTVTNASTDLLAKITAQTPTNDKPEYFDVTASLDQAELDAVNTADGDTEAILTVTVKLLMLPIEEDSVTANIGVSVLAEPDNPEA